MKKLFLLLALCGMVAVGCTEGGVDDNIDNGGNNTEQPGEDDDDENEEDETTFITDSEGNVVVEAEGGEVVVTVTTDIEYSVEIPEEAQSWLSVADTRTIRMEKLTFTVAGNNTFEERSANVELVDSDGKSLQTIKFLQHASDKVFEIDDEGKYIIEAQGGVIEVDVTTNIEYDVVIPDDAQQWISVADTRAEVRNEKLTFTVAANETFEERSADVELVDSDGKSLQTINFTQLAKSNVMANNEIWYTTTDNKRIFPPSTEPTVFGAYFISNTYSDGKGVLTFDGEITKIGNDAFKDIGNLASITIPDSVTSIGSNPFYGCSNLTSITIPDSVTSIGKNAFSGFTGELIVNCNIPSASSYQDGVFYDSDFTKVTIGDSVTSIGDHAFRGCTSLTSVTIPDSVTSIGRSAFYYCNSLTSITIPDSVTSIGSYAFYYCTSLTSVTIPDSVTSIGNDAFNGCTGELIVNCNIPSASWSDYGAFYGSRFTQVTIGDSVTSIGDYAFSGCNSLTSVYIADIAAWCNISFGNDSSNPLSYAENIYLNNELVTDLIIPDSVTSIGDWAFSYCDSLTSVTIGNGVTSIGDYAFYGCDSLTSITIPDSVTSIGGSAFWDCDSLKSITIPDSVTSIGGGAFCDCTSLKSITIPDSVTSIGDRAFDGCGSLKSVTIGTGVTSIGEDAFYYCGSLKEVYCKPTTPPTGDDDMFAHNASGRKIYVPSNSVSAYKSASGWSEYKSYIVGYDF